MEGYTPSIWFRIGVVISMFLCESFVSVQQQIKSWKKA